MPRFPKGAVALGQDDGNGVYCDGRGQIRDLVPIEIFSDNRYGEDAHVVTLIPLVRPTPFPKRTKTFSPFRSDAGELEVKEIVVQDLRDGTDCGAVCLTREARDAVEVDSRPSDAPALALRVDGRLEDVVPVPKVDAVLSELEGNPDIARWTTALERSRARLRLEKAQQIPNLTFKRGIKNDQRGKVQTTYIAGISLPLQLFDRNQHEMTAARARFERTKALRKDAFVETRAEVEAAYRDVEAAYEEATRLKQTSLPNARGLSVG